MKIYIKKVSKTLLFGLIIIAILGLIYLAIPKYQIHSVRVDDDTVVVTRINTITGKITTSYKSGTFPYLDKYLSPIFKKKTPFLFRFFFSKLNIVINFPMYSL